jgi:glutaredoxin
MSLLCDYGCGNTAQFVTKNNKNCCSLSNHHCPKLKQKRKEGQLRAYVTGKRVPYIFTDEDRVKSNEASKATALQKAFTYGSAASNHYIKRLLKEAFHVPDVCNECGVGEWKGQKLTLELDHIDGNSSNNQIENLRLLCPNCHSLTSTWKGKSINTGKCNVTDSELLDALKSSKNVRQALLKVKLAPKGANYARAYKLLKDIESSQIS